jgi:hypothetical protein
MSTVGIGSDGSSTAKDINVTKETTTRSRPVVKHAGPTCVLRGVMREHTTLESLGMISNLRQTKLDPNCTILKCMSMILSATRSIYHNNRNGRLFQKCAVGEGFIQRMHHWSLLSDEVEFVQTQRDIERASLHCAKDRHVFP